MEENSYYYFQRGKRKINKGDIEGGLADIDYAIYMEEDNPLYYLVRGEYRWNHEEWNKAIDDLTFYIEAAIDELKHALNKRWIAYGYLERFEEEIADLDWLNRNGLGDDSTYSEAGRRKLQQGLTDVAIDDFTRAYELAPEEHLKHIYLFNRAQACYFVKRYDCSLTDLNQLLDLLNETLPEQRAIDLDWVYLWRGKAHYRAGDLKQALADFNTSMRLSGQELLDDVDAYMERFDQPIFKD